MSDELLSPKFLTPGLAELVVKQVLGGLPKGVDASQCHIVVLVPAMKDDRAADYPAWPDYPIHPLALYEKSVGDLKKWSHPFDEIARCKALQLWHGRNSGGTDADVQPHLLFPGDTPFWGGVRRHGIVVACSGLHPWLDRMVSGMAADMLVGLAYGQWMESTDRRDKLSFLT